jgi:hypothetical protein
LYVIYFKVNLFSYFKLRSLSERIHNKMNIGTLLIIIFIYIILAIVSLYFTDFRLKIAYWFVVALGTLTAINIYLSITYYISLRNDVGIAGPRGPKGDLGPAGDVGKCTLSETCGIQNCDDKLFAIAAEIYPDIPRKCIEDPNTCDDVVTKEKALPLNNLFYQLIDECKKTKMPEDEFMRRIRPQIELMESSGS